MHNFHAIFASFLDIDKHSSNKIGSLADSIKLRSIISKFSDLKIIALRRKAENLSIDS